MCIPPPYPISTPHASRYPFSLPQRAKRAPIPSPQRSRPWETSSGVLADADGSTHLFVLQGIFGSGTSSVAAMGAPAFTDSLSKWGRDDTIHENVRVSLSHQSRADEIRFGTSLESVAIPEPGTLALLGGALASLLYLRRRRR